ncbi:MAG TPA: hypothetical protein VE988_18155 [Gemmataceae bacterium]|nr:hypothetical protein [Gemmataceae bacterium]
MLVKSCLMLLVGCWLPGGIDWQHIVDNAAEGNGFASHAPSKAVVLGELRAGMTSEEVKKLLGPPSGTECMLGFFYIDHYHFEGFMVEVHYDDGTSVVTSFKIIATPSTLPSAFGGPITGKNR